ncbi:hypothetical protein SZ25_00606 [Candidatus Arcanobacter lacustris]|uniref:Uncharacterized protein n=1 Tax=Candidatus Arcanibacter lacustris TaxID=1607817 RepID=A0A0F5MNZ8_9RICK|nr:hypothetical protein SZ25_00606 [Candidatus Arcanobacter lacustris]
MQKDKSARKMLDYAAKLAQTSIELLSNKGGAERTNKVLPPIPKRGGLSSGKNKGNFKS